MQFLQLFGGNSRGQQADASPSLLADWNSYSNRNDVEAGGGASTTGASSILNSAQSGAQKAGAFLQDSFTRVQSGITSGASTVASSAEAFSIPSTQQLVYFFSFLAAGALFLALAFLLFLPVIILTPSKFALSFTLGCLSIMAGFMQLRGWKQQMQHMMSSERLPYSLAYVGSVLATLYAALVMRSYLLSLLCSGLQVVALLYYLLSYFPGGAQGVKFMLGLFSQAAVNCMSGVYAMLSK